MNDIFEYKCQEQLLLMKLGVSLNVDCSWQIIAAFIFCNLVFHTLFIECRLIN